MININIVNFSLYQKGTCIVEDITDIIILIFRDNLVVYQKGSHIVEDVTVSSFSWSVINSG